MNKDNLQKFIDRLHASKDRQCFGMLKESDGSFCAFGVLCDLVDPLAWDSGGWGDSRSSSQRPSGSSPSIADWLQIGKGQVRKLYRALTKLNDNDRLSFQQISERVPDIVETLWSDQSV